MSICEGMCDVIGCAFKSGNDFFFDIPILYLCSNTADSCLR